MKTLVLSATLLFFTLGVLKAQQKVTGIVNDDQNQIIPGATVFVKGTANAVITDRVGAFTLFIEGELPATIEASIVGYEPFEIVIYEIPEEPVVLTLKSANILDEVVVVGYTTQNKRDFTGAASGIKSSQLENRPAQSFDQMLGGQASGVDIIQPTGTLNSTPVFRIRGINSISSGIYPLIVIDGVAVFTGQVGGAVGNNPLSNINPNDIESIDVLKDASATAIYGSRAANGVVVITTKKGKAGGVKVTYDSWVSVSTPFNLPPLLKAADYVELKNEAMVNAGREGGFALQTRSDGSIVETDWYDVAYRNPVSHSHNVSVSGASNRTNYFLSAGYTDQDGIVRTNEFKNKVVRFNLEHTLINNLNIGINFSVNNSFNKGPNTGSLPGQYLDLAAVARMTNILPPNVSVYNEDGSYNIQDNQRVGYGANNAITTSPGYVGTLNAYNLQLILDKDNYESETNGSVGNLFAEWTFLNDFKLKTSYGINLLKVTNTNFLNPVHGNGGATRGSATNSDSKYYRTDWTTTLAYSKTIAENHNVSALAGYEEIFTTIDRWGATRSNVTDPFFTSYQGGFTNITAANNLASENGFVSYFFNLNYNYKGRYLVSGTFRRDGYSGLADGNEFGNFSGGSVGWNISEESFFKNSFLGNTLNYLQLKASYGQVGNVDIGDFPSLGLYNAGTYAGTPTLGFSQAGNPGLQWETSKKTNVGFNLALLGNRITIEADYYNNVTDGLILNAKQAPSKGIPGNTISANVGSMYNTGFEISIGAQVIRNGELSWNVNTNFSTLKNRVTKLADGIDIYTPSNFGIQNITREGYSLGSIFAIPTVGVNPDNGRRIFVNRNDELVQYNHAGPNRWTYMDGSVAPALDNYVDGRVQGASLPKYFGGITNTLTYRNFDFSFLFTFAGGHKMYNGTRANLLDQRYFNNGTFVKSRWTTEGQITDVPKLVYGDNVSTGFSISNSDCVESGDYLKLKNIALGYKIPVAKITNGQISSARIYAQAANLFTVTNYRGADPESSINGNSIASGKDHNTVVNATVYTLGLNLQF